MENSSVEILNFDDSRSRIFLSDSDHDSLTPSFMPSKLKLFLLDLFSMLSVLFYNSLIFSLISSIFLSDLPTAHSTSL